MKRHFEDLEEEIKTSLLRMGALCEEMIQLAVSGLTERKEEPLREVAAREEEVNRLHIAVDELCLRMIALHQPTAVDLRFIMAAVKINSDLERIGDQAVNISETTETLLKLPPLKRKLLDIPRMVEVARGMLKDSLDAWMRRDVALASEVVKRDAEEDQLKTQSFNELMHLMQSDSSTIQRALCLILIARNLERVADHATNIAEDVIFMVLGKDIRHSASAAAEQSS